MVGKVEFFRMDRLTGTNLQYHLLGDLMADDDLTTPGESGTGVRPTAVTNFVLLLLRLEDKPFLKRKNNITYYDTIHVA